MHTHITQALVLGRVAPKLAVAAPRMLVQPVRAAAEGPAATPSPAAATAEGEKPLKMNRADSWKLAYDRLKNREIHEYKVLSFNKGGLMIKLGEAKGFVPYSYLDPKRFPGGKTPHPDVMDMIATALVGTTMKLRIIRCDVPNKDMVLSERDVLIDAAIKSVSRSPSLSLCLPPSGIPPSHSILHPRVHHHHYNNNSSFPVRRRM